MLRTLAACALLLASVSAGQAARYTDYPAASAATGTEKVGPVLQNGRDTTMTVQQLLAPALTASANAAALATAGQIAAAAAQATATAAIPKTAIGAANGVAALGPDLALLPQSLPRAATAALLRMRPYAGLTAGTLIARSGYFGAGDGGDDVLWWDDTATDLDDGCSTFQPLGLVGPGRYRTGGHLDLVKCGADRTSVTNAAPANDSGPAWNALAEVVYDPATGKFRPSSALAANANRTHVPIIAPPGLYAVRSGVHASHGQPIQGAGVGLTVFLTDQALDKSISTTGSIITFPSSFASERLSPELRDFTWTFAQPVHSWTARTAAASAAGSTTLVVKAVPSWVTASATQGQGTYVYDNDNVNALWSPATTTSLGTLVAAGIPGAILPTQITAIDAASQAPNYVLTLSNPVLPSQAIAANDVINFTPSRNAAYTWNSTNGCNTTATANAAGDGYNLCMYPPLVNTTGIRTNRMLLSHLLVIGAMQTPNDPYVFDLYGAGGIRVEDVRCGMFTNCFRFDAIQDYIKLHGVGSWNYKEAGLPNYGNIDSTLTADVMADSNADLMDLGKIDGIEATNTSMLWGNIGTLPNGVNSANKWEFTNTSSDRGRINLQYSNLVGFVNLDLLADYERYGKPLFTATAGHIQITNAHIATQSLQAPLMLVNGGVVTCAPCDMANEAQGTTQADVLVSSGGFVSRSSVYTFHGTSLGGSPLTQTGGYINAIGNTFAAGGISSAIAIRYNTDAAENYARNNVLLNGFKVGPPSAITANGVLGQYETSYVDANPIITAAAGYAVRATDVTVTLNNAAGVNALKMLPCGPANIGARLTVLNGSRNAAGSPHTISAVSGSTISLGIGSPTSSISFGGAAVASAVCQASNWTVTTQ